MDRFRAECPGHRGAGILPAAFNRQVILTGALRQPLMEAFSYNSITMSALVIRSFPDAHYARLRQTAAVHRRSFTQETRFTSSPGDADLKD